MKIDMFVELVAFQCEGIDEVYNRLESSKIKIVTLSPYYFIETGDKNDLRLPPLDLDGEARVLERPLWGNENVKYGKKYLLFAPNSENYAKTPYRPNWKKIGEDFCALVIQEGKRRGFTINISIPGNPIPNFQDTEFPKDVYGDIHIPKISNKGCINNPNVYNYYIGLAKDISQKYTPDGIMVDWIEYTNYYFTDNLICFCDHCRSFADKVNNDFDKLKNSVETLLNWIKNVKEVPEMHISTSDEIWEVMSPNIHKLFEFKAEICFHFIQKLRLALDNEGFENITLIFPGFAPPMNRWTGFDYRVLSKAAENIIIQPKGYRFHWGLMVKWYSDEFARINGNIPSEKWIPFIKTLLEVEDPSEDYSHFIMPEPDSFGPVLLQNEFKKLDSAKLDFGDNEKIAFRLHGYGPIEMFKKRLEYAKNSGYENIAIQRYGYLSNEKISLIKDII